MAKVSDRPTLSALFPPQSPKMFMNPRPNHYTSHTTPAPYRGINASPTPNHFRPQTQAHPLPQAHTQSQAQQSTSHLMSPFEMDDGPSSPESYYSSSSTPPSSHPITPPTPLLSIPPLPSASSSSFFAPSSSSSSAAYTSKTTPIHTPTPRPPCFLGRNKTTPHVSTKRSANPKNKHQAVQLSLELKVERSKGFHSFFVPLARPLPGAPPSSPVFGASSNGNANSNSHGYGTGSVGGTAGGRGDYFSCRDYTGGLVLGGKVESREEWVEDVGMDLDS